MKHDSMGFRLTPLNNGRVILKPVGKTYQEFPSRAAAAKFLRDAADWIEGRTKDTKPYRAGLGWLDRLMWWRS